MTSLDAPNKISTFVTASPTFSSIVEFISDFDDQRNDRPFCNPPLPEDLPPERLLQSMGNMDSLRSKAIDLAINMLELPDVLRFEIRTCLIPTYNIVFRNRIRVIVIVSNFLGA